MSHIVRQQLLQYFDVKQSCSCGRSMAAFVAIIYSSKPGGDKANFSAMFVVALICLMPHT